MTTFILTKQQRDRERNLDICAVLYHQGKTPAEIAAEMGLAKSTIGSYLTRIRGPLQVHQTYRKKPTQTIAAGLHPERSLPPTQRTRAHQKPRPRPDYTDQDMLRVSIETGGIRIDRIGEVMPWLVK